MQIKDSLFEVKIQYNALDENGKDHKFTENYLVDAVNFGDAETKTIEHTAGHIPGYYTIVSVKRSNVVEIFDFLEGGEKWFKARVIFITVGENGKEKKDPNHMLIQADDIKSARERLEEKMEGTLVDVEVVKIEETAILEFI